jgi:hypothetical protein
MMKKLLAACVTSVLVLCVLGVGIHAVAAATNTNLSAISSATSSPVLHNITISGALTDSVTGLGIPNANVILSRSTDNGGTWSDYSNSSTNELGQYIFNVNETDATNTTVLYKYHVRFDGTAQYNASQSNDIAVTWTMISTTLSATVSSARPTVGQNFSISGRLTADGSALNATSIVLYRWNPATTVWGINQSTTTNTSGDYLFSINESVTGNNLYASVFAGNNTYGWSFAYVTVAIETPTAITASSSTSTTTVGQGFTISGQLTADGTGLAGQTVTLLNSTDNATWTSAMSTTTNATGNYGFIVIESSAGIRYYKASFAGNATHASATSDVVTVAITAVPTPSISITIVQLVPVAPQYLEWDITNTGTADAWVAPSAKLYLQTETPPGYALDGTATGHYVNNATTFTIPYAGLGWVHILPGQTYRIYSQAVVPSDAKWALYNADTFYNGDFHGLLYPNWDKYVTLR